MFSFSKNYPLLYNDYQQNKVMEFNTTDQEDLFLENKKKLGKSWRYYDKPITYIYNELGLRTVPLSEIQDKHIVAFGCSYTEGIGLPLEETWTYQLSDLTGNQVINLGTGGGGNDIIYAMNILYSKYCRDRKIKPKSVVIQWSFPDRKSYVDYIDDRFYFSFGSGGADRLPPINDPTYLRNLYHVNDYNGENAQKTYDNYIFSEGVNELWSSQGVQCIQWAFKGDYERDASLSTKVHLMDMGNSESNEPARDLQHNGYWDNKYIAEQVSKLV